MEDLIISGTKRTPEVNFRRDGHMRLAGRSIPEDPTKFYDALYIWVYEYCQNPPENTHIDIELEYFNSGSSRSVLHIMRELADLRNKGKNVSVNWYYEEGDDDVLERGNYYATILNLPFSFIPVE
ncbi:MAG: DUF1987 domain-containing protein [Bacteroidales bacterium]